MYTTVQNIIYNINLPNRWSDPVKPWNVQSKSKPQALAWVTGSLLYMHNMSQRCSHSPVTVSQSHICVLHSLDRCSWWQRSLPFCFDELKSIALSFHSRYKACTSLSLYYCIHAMMSASLRTWKSQQVTYSALGGRSFSEWELICLFDAWSKLQNMVQDLFASSPTVLIKIRPACFNAKDAEDFRGITCHSNGPLGYTGFIYDVWPI